MRTLARVGLLSLALGVVACSGHKKPTAAELANEATMRSLVGTWRAVNRDGTLNQRDHYRLEYDAELREMFLVWVAEADEKGGKYLKGDETKVVRFTLDGRKLVGERAWGGSWIKVYDGFVSEDLRQLQYRLPSRFLATGCTDAAGNSCTDPEKFSRVP
jgi:hypothetical protein